MDKRSLMGFAVAAAIAVSATALSAPASAQPQGYGPGMMGGYGPGASPEGYGPGPGGYGPWMMGPGGYGMGPWMMGPGGAQGYMGPWMMGRGWGGPGWGGQQADLNLSVGDVKNFFERWLAMQGNPLLILGDVKEKDADTVTVDVVTKDKKGLAQRYVVNRHTGFFRPDLG